MQQNGLAGDLSCFYLILKLSFYLSNPQIKHLTYEEQQHVLQWPSNLFFLTK